MKIPFAYRANVIHGKKRGFSFETVVDFVEVAVPEVDKGAMIPAMSWMESSLTKREVWYSEQGFAECCQHARVTFPNFDHTALSSNVALCAATGLGGYLGHDHGSDEMVALQSLFSPHRKPVMAENVREEAFSMRAERMEEAKRFAETLMLIDGVIWRKVSEPVLCVTKGHGRSPCLMVHVGSRQFGDILDISRKLRVSGPAQTRFYKIDDQGSAADDFFAARAAAGAAEVIDIHEPPVVHEPAVFTFNRYDDAVFRAAERVMVEFPLMLRKQPRRAVEAWLDLRDLTNEEQDVEAIESALDRLHGEAIDMGEMGDDIAAAAELWQSSSVLRHPFENTGARR